MIATPPASTLEHPQADDDFAIGVQTPERSQSRGHRLPRRAGRGAAIVEYGLLICVMAMLVLVTINHQGATLAAIFGRAAGAL